MEPNALIALLSGFALILFIFGTPVFLLMGVWVLGAHLIYSFPLENIGSSLFEGLNSFALLAAPLFILTGDLIAGGGIARRMTDFSQAVLGWVRGGLGMSTVATCSMFAAISGSNSATTATIGSITYPNMNERGYPARIAAATTAAGGVVGIIIPPSILFIVYGYLTNSPVSELFMAGIIPGLLMTAVMMLVIYCISRKHRHGDIIPFRTSVALKTFPGVSIGLAAGGIVLWGIYAGVFSPTEAGAVTVIYCIFASMFVTREMSLRSLPRIILRSGMIVGIIMPLVAISLLMQQIFAVMGVGVWIANTIGALGGYYTVMFACMAIVLVTGTILESVPNTVILAPILAPLAVGAGIDPIHFAIIFMVGSAIGFITPPFGLNLYVAAGVTGVPYLSIARGVMPYLFGLLAVWVLIALIPELSVYLTQFAGR
jgi:C4-dicarboxylate transporter, DctM subunit